MTSKQIKSLALLKLKGSWGNVISISLSFMATFLLVFLGECFFYMIYREDGDSLFLSLPSDYFPISLIVALSLVFYIILIMIYYTFIRELIDIKNGRPFNTSLNRIVGYKKLFVKISLFPHFAIVGILLLCALPGLLAMDSIRSLANQTYDRALSVFVLLFFMMSVLIVLFSIFLIVTSALSLYLLPIIIMNNPLIPLSQAISICYKKSTGNRMKILTFHLSFLKYLPLCLLIYPIVIILPYYVMSSIILVEDILGKELSTDIFLDIFTEKEDSLTKGN